MVYLDRFGNGEVHQSKSCSSSPLGHKFLCGDPMRGHTVHCCYSDMCNDNVNLTFPPPTVTKLPSSYGRGKDFFFSQ